MHNNIQIYGDAFALADTEAKLPFLLAAAGDFFLFIPLCTTRAENANHANDNKETSASKPPPHDGEPVHPFVRLTVEFALVDAE